MGADCCGGDTGSRHDPHAASRALAHAEAEGLVSKDLKARLERVAAYLGDAKRSGVRIHGGVLNGTRVSYFRGKHAVAALDKEVAEGMVLRDADIPHDHEHDHDHEDAVCDAHQPLSKADRITATLETLVLHGLIVRVDKHPQQKKVVSITALQSFDPAEYYVLAYTPHSLFMTFASLGLVAVVLAGVMFPLWPEPLRVGVSYLSYAILGLLGVLFALAIVRLVVYGALYAVGKPGWLFPNLFADVGILESFVPVWEWESSTAAAPADAKPKSE
ncbi:Translocation protein S62 [Blastocladiella emersonii ATCC 22665]|nr:Translocation protein S62 [Blastocladiella emersonii ATCC 22665]